MALGTEENDVIYGYGFFGIILGVVQFKVFV